MQKTSLDHIISRKAIIQSVFSVGGLSLIHIFLGGGSLFPSLIIYCYWFLTGTIAALYGTFEGLFAAFLCILSFVMIQAVYEPDLYSNVWQYFEYPIIWIFTAMLFGEIKAQSNVTLAQAQEHLNAMEDNNAKLQQHLTETQKEIKKQQQELIQSNEIIENMITSLASLLTLKPTQLLLNVENTVQEILKPQKFSIYGKGGGGFEVLISHGWKSDEPFPLRILPNDPLFEHVVVHKETIVANTPQNIAIMNQHGIFAAPLINPDTTEVFGLFKIEEVGEKPLNANFIGVAEGLSKFIGESYTLVKQFHGALKTSIFAKESHIYSYIFYEKLHPYLLNLAQKIGFPLVYFHILLRPAAESMFFREMHILTDLVQRTLPENTLYFMGKEPSNEIIALLPASPPRMLESIEQQLLHELEISIELQSSKVYVTRKVEYIPESQGAFTS